jgi:2-polyprenyl-6-methoxyphenol hydroxylase-like FAD-dependent oxidoreductase
MDARIDVLVVGAGPVGLTAALELRRRGVGCVIVDKLVAAPRYAKAVGVQPRTLELWAASGVLPAALDASIALRGQRTYRNGELVADLEFDLPPDMTYGFAALPQYETERLLAAELARYATTVERGVELVSFDQDEDGVTARFTGRDPIRTRYLVGCDGAHSVVRKALGLAFEGGALAAEYMLGDVEVDWAVPPGFSVRATHETDGRVDDLLVAIPLPGRHRYRLSMLAPPELATRSAADDDVAHGFEGGRRPELAHLQAVLDRLAPGPAVAADLRWSSVFRISHRIVDRYGRGRVFVAGDAAHIHPPTGGQGMNTGVQDATNLAWKLAVALACGAAPGLLDSYDAERRPIAERVVAEALRLSTSRGPGVDPDDTATEQQRAVELTLGFRYRSAAVVLDDGDSADAEDPHQPSGRPGFRAPHVWAGDRLSTVDLFGDGFVLLSGPDGGFWSEVAAKVTDRFGVGVRTHTVDGEEFLARYGIGASGASLVRPDGVVAWRTVDAPDDPERALLGVLATVLDR